MILLLLRCLGPYTAKTYFRIKYATRLNSTQYEYTLAEAERRYSRVEKLEAKVRLLKEQVMELALQLLEETTTPSIHKQARDIIADL
jgi:hypothetical protein